jgi:hypothetical protein
MKNLLIGFILLLFSFASMQSVASCKSVIQTTNDIACAAVLPQNKNGTNPYTEEDNLISGQGDNVIKKSTNGNEFIIYPNPIFSNSNLTIEYLLHNHGIAIVEIFDVVGAQVMQTEISSDVKRVSFNIGNLSPGVYKLKITQNNCHLQTLKFNVF